MSRRKRDDDQAERSPAYRHGVRSCERHKTPISFRSLRIARFAALLVAFPVWGTGMACAEVSEAEKATYADALAYCREVMARPVALRSDRRVLCLDGGISEVTEVLLADGLEQGGVFVVRGHSGDMALTMELAELLLMKQATVVVSDYCLAICADYLFIASTKTFVPKDSLVAWINHGAGPDNDCIGFSETSEPTAPYFLGYPCAGYFSDARILKILQLKNKFHDRRVFRPEFRNPPQSFDVRRILKRKFDATGRYPYNFHWTWNPRYYPGAIRTKVSYEAYPQSQDEVDALLKRIGLSLSVIYDP
ncbi:hypothetical protein [Bradyrhizobium sp.]|uniref:hypothetical protein n=1 Tax=Bradyrhizobium sp. TaxID=376 RepID=UPI002734DEC3|nr:hypothetical protein [Bradyrhizobium sp.]MDP3076654.1 hypothetical protein [Bradyrhizobium sp.]